MRTTIKYFMMCMVCTFCFVGNVSAHEFVHPGTIFNQSDLDRMKAMVAAKKEPFYSAYQRMKADAYSNRGARGLFTQIPESQFNNIIGTDGRAALQKALIWKIEGIQSYAESAVAILNSYKNLKNCSSRGTGPLDNGKVYALIDAAELMRDYPGWKEADQQAFKNMLVYPGYSTTENYYNKYASNNDDNNGITFYWNIFNGDSGRH
ncbi:MAG: sugar-binding protein, partial [Prevotellaceae bacterium]|nr:sugar-binding protein [Prevotellaceae bacterium]